MKPKKINYKMFLIIFPFFSNYYMTNIQTLYYITMITNDITLNLQVFVDKFGRMSIVGIDAPHLGRSHPDL